MEKTSASLPHVLTVEEAANVLRTGRASAYEAVRNGAIPSRRFVVLSEEQADAVALWVLHTHALPAADTTPYLAITSAEKRSGKTTLLEVLELLVARPWLTGRTTTAALVRKVDKVDKVTVLLDESDAAFNGDKEYGETLRGVLNTGYRLSIEANTKLRLAGSQLGISKTAMATLLLELWADRWPQEAVDA
jgi:hypothetical protein